MVFVTSHFHGDKKASVQTVLHSRPSSISSYHSSRVPSGCNTWPKSNGGKSRALWPPLRVFWRRICRMTLSNSASSSGENCATMFSISWSVLIRLSIRELTAPGKPATVSTKPCIPASAKDSRWMRRLTAAASVRIAAPVRYQRASPSSRRRCMCRTRTVIAGARAVLDRVPEREMLHFVVHVRRVVRCLGESGTVGDFWSSPCLTKSVKKRPSPCASQELANECPQRSTQCDRHRADRDAHAHAKR